MNHLKSTHPSFVAWGRKNARNVIVALVIMTGVRVTSIFLSPGNNLILFSVTGGFAVVIAIGIYYEVIVRRRFRLAWKEKNAEGTQSNA